MQFDIKQGLADCRKAYENKTLQFFMEPHAMPGFADDPEEAAYSSDASCQYFTEAEGKCYTCAVGAMVTAYKDTIIEKDLNTMTGVNTLFNNLGLETTHWYELNQLQQRHDRVVVAKLQGEGYSDYEESFLEVLTELEEKYA